MKFALIVFLAPKAGVDYGATQRWDSSIFQIAQAVQDRTGVEHLNDGAYLVNLEGGLVDLAALVNTGHRLKLAHRTLFFPDRPTFVETPAGA